ncbi:MAG: hypothetical protein V7642_6498 [Burkholderiales bacterium]
MNAPVSAGGLLPDCSCICSPVFPAQAGIHKPVDIASSAWIPACAGKTVI